MSEISETPAKHDKRSHIMSEILTFVQETSETPAVERAEVARLVRERDHLKPETAPGSKQRRTSPVRERRKGASGQNSEMPVRDFVLRGPAERQRPQAAKERGGVPHDRTAVPEHRS